MLVSSSIDDDHKAGIAMGESSETLRIQEILGGTMTCHLKRSIAGPRGRRLDFVATVIHMSAMTLIPVCKGQQVGLSQVRYHSCSVVRF